MIQLRPPNLPLLYKINLRDARRVERKNTLDANAVGNLADSDRLIQSRASAGDHNTFKVLDALFFALDHPDRNVHRVPGSKLRNILTELRSIDGVYDLFHGRIFYLSESGLPN